MPLGNKSCRGITRHSLSVEDVKEPMLVFGGEEKAGGKHFRGRTVSMQKHTHRTASTWLDQKVDTFE